MGEPNPTPTPKDSKSCLLSSIVFFIILKFRSFDLALNLLATEFSLPLYFSLNLSTLRPTEKLLIVSFFCSFCSVTLVPNILVPKCFFIFCVYSFDRINAMSAVLLFFLGILIPKAFKYPGQIASSSISQIQSLFIIID